MEKTLRGDGALAVTKIVKDFRLSDLSKVPLKYLKLDEASIKKDIALGVDSIPGIDIFEEKKVSLRTR